MRCQRIWRAICCRQFGHLVKWSMLHRSVLREMGRESAFAIHRARRRRAPLTTRGPSNERAAPLTVCLSKGMPKWNRRQARIRATSLLVASARSHRAPTAVAADRRQESPLRVGLPAAPLCSAGNGRSCGGSLESVMWVSVQRASYLPMPLREPYAKMAIADVERASAAQIQVAGGGWDPYVVWYERVSIPWREALEARAATQRPSSDVATA